MDVSIFLAKVIGVYLIVTCGAMLYQRKRIRKLIGKIDVEKPTFLVVSIMPLLIGLLIVIGHPVYELNWKGLITLFGWLGLIKGVLYLYFPKHASKFIKSYKKPTTLLVTLAIMLVIGVVLAYFGFDSSPKPGFSLW